MFAPGCRLFGQLGCSSLLAVVFVLLVALFSTADAAVYTCGNNLLGRTGLNSPAGDTLQPTAITGTSLPPQPPPPPPPFPVDNVAVVSGGKGAFSFFITAQGRPWGCGQDDNYELGVGGWNQNNNNNEADWPEDVFFTGCQDSGDDPCPPSVTTWSISAGTGSSMMITWNGLLYGFGGNAYNEIAPSDPNNGPNILYPQQLRVATGQCVLSASVSAEHSLFATAAGQVWTIGHGTNGRTGQGNTHTQTQYVQISALYQANVTVVATGISWSLAIGGNGTVWAFGANNNGQLGLGAASSANVLLPTIVTALDGVTIVAADAGANHSVFLSAAGTVYTCGLNSYGQLGLGDSVPSADVPTLVTTTISAVRIVRVAAGSNFVLLLSDAGNVYGFGQDNHAQLCSGTARTAQTTPVLITMPGAVSSIGAGDMFSMFVVGGPPISFPSPCTPQLPTTGIQPTTHHVHTTGSTGSTSTGYVDPWLTTSSTTSDPFAVNVSPDTGPANLGGIIAGSVIGGIVFIVALTGGCIWFAIRRGATFRLRTWGWNGVTTTRYFGGNDGSGTATVALVNTSPGGMWGGSQNFMFYGANGMPIVVSGPPPDYNDANYVDEDEDLDIPPEIQHMINTYGYARFELDPDSHAYSRAKLHLMEGLQLPHPDYPNIVFSIEAIDFVYNPELEEMYEQCKQHIMNKYPNDQSMHRERFAFHGCRPAVVPAICQNGLLHIGHPKNPSQSTDEGFFGDPHFGVYVSRYIHYTLKYSNGLMPLRPGEVTEIIMVKCIPARELRFEKIELGAKPHPDYDSHVSPNYLEWYLPLRGQCVPTHVVTIKANKANRKLVSDDGIRNSLYQDEPSEGDRKGSKAPRKITLGVPLAGSAAPAAPGSPPAAVPGLPPIIPASPATLADPNLPNPPAVSPATVVLPVPLDTLPPPPPETLPPPPADVIVAVLLENSPPMDRANAV